MSLLVLPSDPNAGGCCDCDRAVDACTCCPYEIGTNFYYEYHGYDECPTIGPPCAEESPSCADIIIGPVKLTSQPFKTKCLDILQPTAFFSIFADNYGTITGKTTIHYDDGPCPVIDEDGSVLAQIEPISDTESRAFIMASAQNSPAGGPYGLTVSVLFVLD